MTTRSLACLQLEAKILEGRELLEEQMDWTRSFASMLDGLEAAFDAAVAAESHHKTPGMED